MPARHAGPTTARCSHTCRPCTAAPCLPAGPLAKIYFGSQFAPLIIFFVMFLSIVKNNKLHHFVRFNCMQVGGWVPGRCWAC
jgi:hypothetical protein